MTDFALREKTLAVILAGGRGTRMGGADKPFLQIDGTTLLERIVAVMRPQCVALVINANGDPSRFSQFGATVISDTLPDYPGPLAGILAALEWTSSQRPDLEWVASVPGDTPFLPGNLVERLHAVRIESGADIACAFSGGQAHPTIALWPLSLIGELRRALTIDSVRAVRDFFARYRVAYADWPAKPFDPFFNINTPEDLAAAEVLARTASTHHD
ncbi:molybdenum cofactor guanylyltransferase MobA [Microvirga flavescens]|uniref:molybdenum cofactor guanylyltransferase MobA n=1 Tax=Microvirga flavescens TaxID=2249811 RepID=UPI000DD85646|nr:molybdenum cofactor guanylyltransferase MobA [Microvirga flavescens]